MNALEKARIEINEVDKKIAELFEIRMDAVKDVLSYKLQNGLPIFDNSREKEVIEKNLILIKNKEYSDYYKKYIQYLMDLSKSFQEDLVNNPRP